jgi:quinol monooxygenase YgiN
MAKRKAKKSSRRRSRGRSSRGVKNNKLPKDAVTIVVMLRAKEGQHVLLEAELRALVSPTRKEEGCLRYDLHSREDHGAHTRTPHFLRWNARKDALLATRESAFWQQIA